MSIRRLNGVRAEWAAWQVIPRWLLALGLITGAISFLFFNQLFDMPITVQQSISLLEASAQGKLFHFYAYVYEQAQAGAYVGVFISQAPASLNLASYSFFLYGLLALWLLPLWLAGQALGRMPLTAYYIWVKLLIALVVVLSGVQVRRLALQLGLSAERAVWSAFFFLASPITLFCSLIFGQFDVFSVFLMLLAIRQLLQRRLIRFALIMAFAATMKVFALFILLPLLLLFEKRLIRLAGYGVLAMSATVLEKILMSADPMYQFSVESIRQHYGFMSRIVDFGLPLQYGVLFPFGIAFVLICALAYRQKETEWQRMRCSVLFPAAIFISLLTFILWHPQWWIVIMPFAVLTMFSTHEWKLGQILLLGLFICFLGVCALNYPGSIDHTMVNQGVLRWLTGYQVTPDALSLGTLFNKLNLRLSVYNTGVAACALTFLAVFWRSTALPADHELNRRNLIWTGLANLALLYAYIIPAIGSFLLAWLRG